MSLGRLLVGAFLTAARLPPCGLLIKPSWRSGRFRSFQEQSFLDEPPVPAIPLVGTAPGRPPRSGAFPPRPLGPVRHSPAYERGHGAPSLASFLSQRQRWLHLSAPTRPHLRVRSDAARGAGTDLRATPRIERMEYVSPPMRELIQNAWPGLAQEELRPRSRTTKSWC